MNILTLPTDFKNEESSPSVNLENIYLNQNENQKPKIDENIVVVTVVIVTIVVASCILITLFIVKRFV